MRIPTVEKCCCGCNLRLGSAIVGIIFFLSALSQLISFSVQADNAVKNGEEENRPTYIINAVLAAIMLCSTGLLLLGVHKEREGWLRPWLLLYGILACINVLIFFIASIIAFATANVGAGVILIIMCIIYVLIYGYCLVVVRSYSLSLSGVPPGTV